ncbi:hypothetical protein [Methylomonas sp. AM2-LC]|uniref:hypothetical protein n=1 Tax=Methylomonas sp. AM2-LC TaxID=3153301 RepID=UPI0032646DD5
MRAQKLTTLLTSAITHVLTDPAKAVAQILLAISELPPRENQGLKNAVHQLLPITPQHTHHAAAISILHIEARDRNWTRGRLNYACDTYQDLHAKGGMDTLTALKHAIKLADKTKTLPTAMAENNAQMEWA